MAAVAKNSSSSHISGDNRNKLSGGIIWGSLRGAIIVLQEEKRLTVCLHCGLVQRCSQADLRLTGPFVINSPSKSAGCLSSEEGLVVVVLVVFGGGGGAI